MPPKRRTTRATSATTTAPTTTVTDAQLQALIDQGVAAALAERDASRSRDGDNNHGSGTGGRRQVPTQRECTYFCTSSSNYLIAKLVISISCDIRNSANSASYSASLFVVSNPKRK
ncbi:hypothetical protein Tco_0744716, partial [Tanacetum coccineum]